MSVFKYVPLVAKYALRYRGRSLLTIGGVASAMFLFYAVQAMDEGVREATESTSKDTKLVVYRQDRYCPFSSNLPQDYAGRIGSISGVKSVLPIKIAVNNCRAGLDVITFRGIPLQAVEKGAFDHIRVTDGSVQNWKQRSDAALIGRRLAARRGLKVGDRADLGGITTYVAGIIDSSEPQEQSVAYSHLEFVQRASDNQVGIVTQFDVTVEDAAKLDQVAKAIDAELQTAQAPTSTWSEKAFVARAAADIVEIVGFARWLGWGCLIGVFALVFNAIVLSVQDRIRDHAVMQTLGYTQGLIARLIVGESLLLSLTGGVLGLAAAMALTVWSNLSLSVEGLSIHVQASTASIFIGLALSALTGVLAGLVPAWQASHRQIASCFRAS